jgi:GNAT superfamily N-acetyltransferase
MPPSVRTTTVDDAATIARIRVDTWRVAYAGLIADDLLAGLDAEREGIRRRERWDEFHSDPRGTELIAEIDGEPAGWAAAGPSRDPELPGHGEVHAIYALPHRWDAGVGHALLEASESFLRSAGFTDALLWYLDGNARAARFYERHGWIDDGATKSDASLVGGDEANALFERRRQKTL